MPWRRGPPAPPKRKRNRNANISYMNVAAPATPVPVRKAYDPKRAARGFALLLAVYLVVVYAIPWSSTIKPGGPRLAGLFLATIVGSVIEPIPAAALVLIAITLAAILGILPIEQALG